MDAFQLAVHKGAFPNGGKALAVGYAESLDGSPLECLRANAPHIHLVKCPVHGHGVQAARKPADDAGILVKGRKGAIWRIGGLVGWVGAPYRKPLAIPQGFKEGFGGLGLLAGSIHGQVNVRQLVAPGKCVRGNLGQGVAVKDDVAKGRTVEEGFLADGFKAAGQYHVLQPGAARKGVSGDCFDAFRQGDVAQLAAAEGLLCKGLQAIRQRKAFHRQCAQRALANMLQGFR